MKLSQVTLASRGDPAQLAAWYAEVLQAELKGTCVLTAEFLIVCEEGQPPAGSTSRMGLQVESLAEVRLVAARCGAAVEEGERFAGFIAQDPAGNTFEVVCELR